MQDDHRHKRRSGDFRKDLVLFLRHMLACVHHLAMTYSHTAPKPVRQLAVQTR